LVSRDVDPEDRRRRRVQITAAGRRLVARATAASQRVLDDILAPLTTAERETVVRLLTAALRPLEG
jgi:DNA-binding MarR family transcriptional regulator